MSGVGFAATPSQPAAGRLSLAVQVFLVLGPPIGGLIMLVAFSYPGRPPLVASVLWTTVVFSYAFGGVQALLAGIGTAVLAQRRGRSSIWHPVLVVVVLHVLAAIGVGIYALATGRPIAQPVPFLLVTSPALSLISAIICWFLARPLLRVP